MFQFHDAFLTIKGIYKYERFLKKSEHFSNDEIKHWQAKWLSDLLIHSYKNIPWYNSVFKIHELDLASKKPLKELQKLPILHKEEVQNNHSSFCISEA